MGGKCGKYECLSYYLNDMLKVLSMSMSRDTIDLADVDISFCRGVAQSSSHRAPVQSTPPGSARTTVGLSTWSVLFMARICSAAGSAWWEELEPFSLHEQLQLSFWQSASRTRSYDLLNLFVPVRLVHKEDHSGGGCRKSICRRWEMPVVCIMTPPFYLVRIKFVFTCVVWQVVLPESTLLSCLPSAGQLTVSVL